VIDALFRAVVLLLSVIIDVLAHCSKQHFLDANSEKLRLFGWIFRITERPAGQAFFAFFELAERDALSRSIQR